MNGDELKQLARRLIDGELTVDGFLAEVGRDSVADLGSVQLDLDRRRRCGFAEVVFGQGKTTEDLQAIVGRLADAGVDVLVTRVEQAAAEALCADFPAGSYNDVGRTFRFTAPGVEPAGGGGRVAIVTAGTSDRPVAEEAQETALWMGATVDLVQDVGVAGPQRLPQHLETLRRADAVVVVAGMEGALPSVVGGHVGVPVIAVPTSVGYGASFSGLAALLGMLNSCAANVTVVNIDAGFKGGYVAGLIAARANKAATIEG